MTDPSTTGFPMRERFGSHPYDGAYPGRPIIVEGIDGAGKGAA